MSIGLVDTHAHLQHEAYGGAAESVLARAHANGIEWVVNVANDLAAADAALAFSQAHPDVKVAIGLHPHNAQDWSAAAGERLAELLKSPAVVALGEIGLDYHYDFSPRSRQLEAFAAQLQLAAAHDLPVVIHARESERDVLRLLQQAAPLKGVWHCFWGDAAAAAAAVDMGLYIGVGGPVTFKNDGGLREVLAGVSLQNLVLETDAPYLAPAPVRGRQNEPAFVAYVAAALAVVQGCSVDEVAAATSANAEKLFGKPDMPCQNAYQSVK